MGHVMMSHCPSVMILGVGAASLPPKHEDGMLWGPGQESGSKGK